MNHPAAGRTIVRNFFSLSAGELAARLVHFAAFAHLARTLGTSEFGRLGLVLTVLSYLMIPVLQGLDSVGIRDVARDRTLLGRYAGNILTIRLLAAAATCGALAGALRWGGLDAVTRTLIERFSLTLFATAISVKWAFQAAEEGRAVAVAGIVAQLGFAAGAFTVRGPQDLLLIPVYLLAGEMAGSLALAAAFFRRFGPFWPQFRLRLWGVLLRESAPLAASTVLGTVLFNFDVLVLARFQPAEVVGLYTAAYKLVLVFATLLTLFQISLFPTLARAHGQRADLEGITGRVLRYVAAAFVPLSFAGLLLGPRLMEFLFGAEYAAGSTALKILLWSLPWMAFRSVFRIILVSWNLQGLDLSAVLGGAVTNVALDLLLVPRFGITGAAVATLCSEFVILFLSYRYVWRRVQPVYTLKHLLRPVMASGVMMACGWPLGAAPLAVQAAVLGVVYVGALVAMQGVTRQEIAGLFRS